MFKGERSRETIWELQCVGKKRGFQGFLPGVFGRLILNTTDAKMIYEEAVTRRMMEVARGIHQGHEVVIIRSKQK